VDNHKITDEYLDNPLELSNAYFLKTIEKRYAFVRAFKSNAYVKNANQMHPGMGSAGFDERVVFDRFIGGIAPKQKLDNLVTKQ
jgi:hypothetical protein